MKKYLFILLILLTVGVGCGNDHVTMEQIKIQEDSLIMDLKETLKTVDTLCKAIDSLNKQMEYK